jgi:hypothetical protein
MISMKFGYLRFIGALDAEFVRGEDILTLQYIRFIFTHPVLLYLS